MNIRTLTLVYNFCTSRHADYYGYWRDNEINDALNEQLAENNITEDNLIDIKTNLSIADNDTQCETELVVQKYVVTVIYKAEKTIYEERKDTEKQKKRS